MIFLMKVVFQKLLDYWHWICLKMDPKMDLSNTIKAQP